jgi:hypothetical protein
MTTGVKPTDGSRVITGRFALSLRSWWKFARVGLYLTRDNTGEIGDGRGFSVGWLMILWRRSHKRIPPSPSPTKADDEH